MIRVQLVYAGRNKGDMVRNGEQIEWDKQEFSFPDSPVEALYSVPTRDCPDFNASAGEAVELVFSSIGFRLQNNRLVATPRLSEVVTAKSVKVA